MTGYCSYLVCLDGAACTWESELAACKFLVASTHEAYTLVSDTYIFLYTYNYINSQGHYFSQCVETDGVNFSHAFFIFFRHSRTFSQINLFNRQPMKTTKERWSTHFICKSLTACVTIVCCTAAQMSFPNQQHLHNIRKKVFSNFSLQTKEYVNIHWVWGVRIQDWVFHWLAWKEMISAPNKDSNGIQTKDSSYESRWWCKLEVQ